MTCTLILFGCRPLDLESNHVLRPVQPRQDSECYSFCPLRCEINDSPGRVDVDWAELQTFNSPMINIRYEFIDKISKRIEVYRRFILENSRKLIAAKKLRVNPISSFTKGGVHRALHISQVNIIGNGTTQDKFTDRFQIEPGKAVL